jgi:WD40 repeat protein
VPAGAGGHCRGGCAAALLTQSRFLASLADQRTAGNDAESALLLALEALPDAAMGGERPYAPEAEFALQKSWQHLRQLKVEDGQLNDPLTPEGIKQAIALVPELISPDGRYILKRNDDTGEIREATTGKVVRVLRGHEQTVVGMAFSRDGRRIVTWSEDRTARLWDTATGASLQVIRGHDGGVTDAGLNGDGSRVITVAANTVRIWNAATAAMIHQLHDAGSEVLHAALSPQGGQALAVSHEDIRIWDGGTGKLVKTLNDPRRKSAVFSLDGTRVLGIPNVTQIPPNVTVWDALAGEKLATIEVNSTTFAAFGADGRQLLIENRRQIETWSVAPRNAGLALAHPGNVIAAAFSPDDTLAITAGLKAARIYDARTGTLLHDLVPQGYYVTGAGFSPDGRTAFTKSDEGGLWDVASGRLITAFDEAPAEFSRATGRLLTLASNGTVRLRDGRSGAAIAELPAGNDVKQVMFASDGRRILAVQEKAVLSLDPDTGTTRAVIPADDRVTLIASVSADRRRALTWSQKYQTAHVWDLDSGRVLHELAGFEGVVDGNGFSDDGRRLAVSTTATVTTRIWDVEENRIIASRRGIVSGEMRFSPDNRRLLLHTSSRQVEVWDAATAKTVAAIEHRDMTNFTRTVWDHGGSRIIIASQHHTARISPMPDSQRLVDRAKVDTARCLTVREREAAFLPPAPPAWCIEMAKWPYRSPDWTEWLRAGGRDASMPLPGTKEWDAWRAAGGAAAVK